MLWLVLLAITAYWLFDWLIRIPCIPVRALKSRYVVITGCDSGFGRVAAKMLDDRGFYVFATCMTQDGEEYLQKSCSGNLRTLRMDVRSRESINKALKFVKQCIPEGQGLCGVISNAGVYPTPCNADWLMSAGYDRIMKANLYGAIDFLLTFLPEVKKVQGRVVIMTSYSGKFATPDGTDYVVSKFGLEGFADSLRRTLRDFGVSVHIVESGFFSTSIGSDKKNLVKIMENAWKTLPEEIQQTYGGDDFLKNPTGLYKDALEWGPDQGSKRLYLIGDAYIHALTARYPRIRYHAGIDAKLFYYPMEWLPDWLTDIVFRKFSYFARFPLIAFGDWLGSLYSSKHTKKVN